MYGFSSMAGREERPLGHKWPDCMSLFVFLKGVGGALGFSTRFQCHMPLRGRETRNEKRGKERVPVPSSALKGTLWPQPVEPCVSACQELICSRTSLFIALWSAQHPQIPHFYKFSEGLGQCSCPSWIILHLLCLRNARTFPLLPAALASVSFGFVFVRSSSLRSENEHRAAEQQLQSD